MGAPKGHERYGGREKGSENKHTKETKELITAFMQNKFDDVTTAWEGLEPVDKVKTYISLVKYVMPTLSSVKVEDNKGEDVLKKILEAQK